MKWARATASPGHPVDHVDREIEPVDLVADGELQRRVDIALFLVAADVEVAVVGAPVGKLVDEPGIAVEVEDDRLVEGEEAVEVPVGEAVGVLGLRLKREKVDHVDEAEPEIGDVLPQAGPSAARASMVGTSPAQARTTSGSHPWSVLAQSQMPIPFVQCRIGLLHVEVLEVGLLVRARSRSRNPCCAGSGPPRRADIGVGGQVDAGDAGALVGHHVEKPGVLVAEPVMVLAPHGGGDQDVERGNGRPPWNLVTFLQPLCMLVEHGIDDVHEGLVGGEGGRGGR